MVKAFYGEKGKDKSAISILYGLKYIAISFTGHGMNAYIYNNLYLMCYTQLLAAYYTLNI